MDFRILTSRWRNRVNRKCLPHHHVFLSQLDARPCRGVYRIFYIFQPHIFRFPEDELNVSGDKRRKPKHSGKQLEK